MQRLGPGVRAGAGSPKEVPPCLSVAQLLDSRGGGLSPLGDWQGSSIYKDVLKATECMRSLPPGMRSGQLRRPTGQLAPWLCNDCLNPPPKVVKHI